MLSSAVRGDKGGIPIVGGVSDSLMRANCRVLARPSKNFTGITFLTDEMAAKRMEFSKKWHSTQGVLR
jgi:putative ABC transport system substrate-binding protein